jgi:signal transduction histidine kinase
MLASQRTSIPMSRSPAPPEPDTATSDSMLASNTLPWRAYIPIALVALLGLLVTLQAFKAVTGWEQQRVQQAFHAAAIDRILMVQHEIEQNLGVVQDIGSFFNATRWVGRREFRKFVGPALKRYTSITALQWIPRLPAAERATFEEEARRSFAKFRITEVNQAGDLIRAEQRPVHFPVLYVQPYQLNRDKLGLDLAADPQILDVLQQTRDSGHMQLAPLTPLLTEGHTEYGFVARLPVYRNNDIDAAENDDEEDGPPETLAQRRQLLRGFAAGYFILGEIVENALQNLSPSGIDMVIYDVSDENERHYLYRHTSRTRPIKASLHNTANSTSRKHWGFIQNLTIRDRQWEVVCTTVPGYFQPDPWSGWATLAGGLPFTALLTIYLSTLVGRTAKVRRLVTERTKQLMAVNTELNSEINERLNAEQELQRLNETLEQRVAARTAEAERHVKELEQFAYVTSHDLKAPLRGIANLASWLEEDLQEKLTATTREQLELLRDRVLRMNALIEGLLEYSRIGKAAQSLVNVDCGELLTEIIDSLAPPEEITINVAADMPTLHTDRIHLYQVFSNLLSNSIKHRRDGPLHIAITVQEQGEYYQFTVADNGPGIAPQYHDKVFMMFQTLTVNDYGSNTGIGLALVKKIVQEHGGSITLQSRERHGATFRFSWPKSG